MQTDDRRISLCIPTWNRSDLLFESFLDVINDERISEVVISDDASDMSIFKEIIDFVKHYPKIRLYRNLTNQDCYRNKMTVVSLAKHEWVVLLDSDNVIGKDYIDKLYETKLWQPSVIYTPSFARPLFDFRAYSGLLISDANVAEYIDKPMFETMLNAANYFVCKHFYLETFDENVNPVTSDSIFMTYRWLANKKMIKVVEGLEYDHRVHNGSHYQNNVHKTPDGFHQNILNQLRQLR